MTLQDLNLKVLLVPNLLLALLDLISFLIVETKMARVVGSEPSTE